MENKIIRIMSIVILTLCVAYFVSWIFLPIEYGFKQIKSIYGANSICLHYLHGWAQTKIYTNQVRFVFMHILEFVGYFSCIFPIDFIVNIIVFIFAIGLMKYKKIARIFFIIYFIINSIFLGLRIYPVVIKIITSPNHPSLPVENPILYLVFLLILPLALQILSIYLLCRPKIVNLFKKEKTSTDNIVGKPGRPIGILLFSVYFSILCILELYYAIPLFIRHRSLLYLPHYFVMEQLVWSGLGLIASYFLFLQKELARKSMIILLLVGLVGCLFYLNANNRILNQSLIIKDKALVSSYGAIYDDPWSKELFKERHKMTKDEYITTRIEEEAKYLWTIRALDTIIKALSMCLILLYVTRSKVKKQFI